MSRHRRGERGGEKHSVSRGEMSGEEMSDETARYQEGSWWKKVRRIQMKPALQEVVDIERPRGLATGERGIAQETTPPKTTRASVCIAGHCRRLCSELSNVGGDGARERQPSATRR